MLQAIITVLMVIATGTLQLGSQTILDRMTDSMADPPCACSKGLDIAASVEARKFGLEGIVSKRTASHHQLGGITRLANIDRVAAHRSRLRVKTT